MQPLAIFPFAFLAVLRINSQIAAEQKQHREKESMYLLYIPYSGTVCFDQSNKFVEFIKAFNCLLSGCTVILHISENSLHFPAQVAVEFRGDKHFLIWFCIYSMQENKQLIADLHDRR